MYTYNNYIQVPPFVPATPGDESANKAASQRQQARMERARTSLNVTIPSLDEQHILHQMHLRGLNSSAEVCRRRKGVGFCMLFTSLIFLSSPRQYTGSYETGTLLFGQHCSQRRCIERFYHLESEKAEGILCKLNGALSISFFLSLSFLYLSLSLYFPSFPLPFFLSFLSLSPFLSSSLAQSVWIYVRWRYSAQGV